MSKRMTNAESRLVLLLCLIFLLTSQNPGTVSVRGFSIPNRQDNIVGMTAAVDSNQELKTDTQDSEDATTLTRGIVTSLKTSSGSSIRYSVSDEQGAEVLARNSNVHFIHTNKNSKDENKKSASLLYSIAKNAIDIDDIFQDESRLDQPPDFARVDFKDEFRCVPCKCYHTLSRNVIATCNASVSEINAILLNETQHLTISNSSMRIFQPEAFLQYHSLQNLSVSHNKHMHAVTNSSDNTHVLVVINLDLSYNVISYINDRSLKMFPHLQSLNLAHNYITSISRSTFEGLNNLQFIHLSRNHIRALITGSFDHFQKLKVLDISRNGVQISFMPGVLSHLQSLNVLYINGNQKHEKRYPSEEIARLTNLTFLSIDGISQDVILGPEIKSLQRLVTLYVGSWKPIECRLKNVTESFLENVPYLETVRFTKCPLQNVDPNVYKNVERLTSLQFISTYPYDIFKALDGLRGLQNSSLKSLSLIGLISEMCPFVCLYGRHAKYLTGIQLEVLDLSDNRVGYMDPEFIHGLPTTLRKLVLRGNELIEPMLLTDKVFFLQNLETFDLGTDTQAASRGRLSQTKTSSELVETHDDSVDRDVTSNNSKESTELLKSSSSVELSNDRFVYTKDLPKDAPVCTEQYDVDDSTDDVGGTNDYFHAPEPELLKHFNTTPMISPMLKHLLAPGFLEMNVKDFFQNIKARGYTQLTDIDFSYCALPSLTYRTSLPASIQTANFNGNYFRRMQDEIFKQNNSLTFLSLNNNVLGNVFANSGGKKFIKLKNVVYLDISMNMIYQLPVNFFRGLKNLKVLIMSDNKLGFLNTNFSTTPMLEYLDLRKNSISSISKTSRDGLDIIGTSHPLYIELTSNPLRCTCEGLEVLHWIWGSNIHFVSQDFLKCILDDGSTDDVGKIDDRVRTLQRQCAGKELIIVMCVASLSLVCFLVVFGVMYRYRWQLRYIRSIALSRFIGYKPRESASAEYRYDAFIVYSDTSRQFVLGDCLQELEVKRGHKLCVDERDFMPGTYNLSAIVSAIQNSRKTVLILSPDFYDEQFSEYSVKMALMEEIYQKRSVLHVCVYQPLPDDEMSKSYDLLMVMKRNNYIEFPPETETSDEVRQNIWDQLSEKLGRSATKELTGSVESNSI